MSLVDELVRSVIVSGVAVALATPVSVVLALWIVEGCRVLAARLAEALVGVPTVLVGLLLYLLLASNGPLGFTGLLYTPLIISIGEAILVTPIYTALLVRGFSRVYWPVYTTLIGVGASRNEARLYALREALGVVFSAAVAAYSRAIGELGVALLVGGNIRGYTRTLSTAISLSVAMGDYTGALARGVILTSVLLLLGFAGWVVSRLYGEPGTGESDLRVC